MSSLVYVLPLLLRYQIQHPTATLRRIAQDAAELFPRELTPAHLPRLRGDLQYAQLKQL
jgi:hypothetical protein